MKNTTKAAGIAGIVMGVLGVGAAIAGSLAKGKDDKVDAANQEFDSAMDNFCENNNEETNTTPPEDNQEPAAPAEED